MSTALRAFLLAALLTVVPVGIGVAVAEDPTPERPRPAYEATALADFDTTTAVVRRAPFCERVHPAAVREALGGAGALSAWANGEPAEALPGKDIAHEHGCRYAAEGDDASAAEARGWVFVPPVTPARAAELLAPAPPKGCRAHRDAPAYGAPSAAVSCTSGGTTTVTFRGLFGDAWLSCSLAVPGESAAGLMERAGRWCVAVAQAASAD